MGNLQEQILDEELDNGIDQPWVIALKYGLIGGIVFVFFELIRYSLGMMDLDQLMDTSAKSVINSFIGMLLTPLSWIIYIVLYFLAIKNYRDELGGFISFGKAYKVSIFSVLIKSVIVFAWGMIFYFILMPDYCQDLLNLVDDTVSQSIGGSSDITTMYSMLYNPFTLTFGSVLWVIIGGAFLSLLAAAIGKKARANS